jgi:hypothetical protein
MGSLVRENRYKPPATSRHHLRKRRRLQAETPFLRIAEIRTLYREPLMPDVTAVPIYEVKLTIEDPDRNLVVAASYDTARIPCSIKQTAEQLSRLLQEAQSGVRYLTEMSTAVANAPFTVQAVRCRPDRFARIQLAHSCTPDTQSLAQRIGATITEDDNLEAPFQLVP